MSASPSASGLHHVASLPTVGAMRVPVVRAPVRRLVRASVVVLLCGGTSPHADVLPPPQPLKCGLGQVVRTDHSGTYCQYKWCPSEAVCPEGMACVTRSETHCDPRGQPCWTGDVSRCAKADRPSPAPRCPQGATADRKRTQAVFARLRTQKAGRLLAAELGRELVVCYGDVREGVLQADGALVLQRDRSVPANAARLGHLLDHLVSGLPFDEPAVRSGKLACSEVVRSAAEVERRAHKLESELRKAFGLPPLPFEDLAEEYRKRCQALRPEAPSRSPK